MTVLRHLLSSLALAATGLAQSEIEADRPDFTEGVRAVGRGIIQYENGVTIARTGATLGLTGGEMLLRAGIGHRLELRLGGDGLLIERRAGGESIRGYSGTEFGVKMELFDETRFRPALSLLPHIAIPSGSRILSSGGYEPTLKVLWGKDLAAGFALSGNVNFASLGRGRERFLQLASSWSVGRRLMSGIAFYAEVHTFAPWQRGGTQSWFANSGLIRALGPNAQFDVRAGQLLNGSGPRWFAGAGIAFRQLPRALRSDR